MSEKVVTLRAINQYHHEIHLFHLPKHHAFSGKLTAIIEGNCTLTAMVKGLKKAIIKIE